MNDFNPATFLLVTGTSEDGGEEISEETLSIINAKVNDNRLQATRDGVRRQAAFNRPLHSSTFTKEHSLEPYHLFLDRVIKVCHEKIDSERENLRMRIAKIHRAHRKQLLMNIEDLWANWFGVPIGKLVEGTEK